MASLRVSALSATDSKPAAPVRRLWGARPRSPWRQYGLAVLGVVAVTLLRLPFETLLQGAAPFALYFPMLAALAWLAGMGPTVLATVLSGLAAWHFFVPAEPGHAASLGIYLITTGALIALSRTAATLRGDADEALRVARRAQRGARAAVWDWDLHSDAIHSPELGRLFGVDADAVRSRGDMFALVNPEDRDRIERTFDAVADGAAGSLELDFRIQHPRLGARWISCVGELERDDDDQAPRLTGLLLDVTDRKLADESRARLAAIVESSADAIIGEDLDGHIRSWNVAAQHLFGYVAEEVIGRPITLLTPHSRRAEQEAILARLRRGERIEPFETERVRKDGGVLDLSLTISPILDASGAAIGASKSARDITAHKRAQRAIAEQREWFRITLASIGDAVITADRAAVVTFLNPVAERLTGWSLGEALGQPIARVFSIVDERTREPIEAPYEKVLRTGSGVGLANHTMLIGRDGSEYPIEDSAAPIVDDQQNVLGVVMVFHDVSERRSIEAERHSRDREREQLLQSERAARGDAEHANRLKDDFVATLSHELRTPLNAVLGWTEIVRRDPRNPETVARGLAVIERNARLQAQLISDLLDVSRIVSGKLWLELQLVSLSVVIGDAIDTVKTLADAKGIVIESAVDSGIEQIAGDPARLQQVVWNLLSNAVKFSPSGGRVRIEVMRVEGFAQITVSDSGVGILSEFVPHLFDRFRQADASTTRRFGGLGLGLTIVKQLVELHGGSISASSAGEGQGAQFVVRLPLYASPASHAATLDAGRNVRALWSNAQAAVSEQVAGLKILVVEDDPDSRELVERLLSEAGACVIAVASAQAALDAIGAQRPDMIVSDIGLPDQDGYSLIETVRRGSSLGSMLPAIALTAFARPEDRARALRAGFQAHLPKPVEPSELLAVIASFARMIKGGQR